MCTPTDIVVPPSRIKLTGGDNRQPVLGNRALDHGDSWNSGLSPAGFGMSCEAAEFGKLLVHAALNPGSGCRGN